MSAAEADDDWELSEADRQALWEQFGTKVKTIYDTEPRAESGLSWAVSSGQPGLDRAPFRTTSVESWLLLTSFRDQRAFLERHPELLGPQSVRHIDRLRTTASRAAAAVPRIAGQQAHGTASVLRDLQQHIEVLQDAQSRGGNAEAVHEAYVNAHGGFAADVPAWAEDTLTLLRQITGARSGLGMQDVRETLLRDAVARAEHDPDLRAETFAEFSSELGRMLGRSQADPSRLAEARSLYSRALRTLDQGRYPRQWLRTAMLIDAADDALAGRDVPSQEHGRAEYLHDLRARGQAHEQAGKWVEAARCFGHVTRLVPDDGPAWLGLAMAYQQLGSCTDALHACERAAARLPDHGGSWTLLGALHQQHGQLSDALTAYQRAVALGADNAALWIDLSNILTALQHKEEALTACERAVACAPDNPFAWHNKGGALDGLGRYEEALAAYDRALSLEPSMAATQASKGNTLLRMSRYREALAEFESAVRQAPEFSLGWQGRGTARLFLGEYADALPDLERAIRLAPDDAAGWNNAAVALDNLGRPEEAVYARRRAEALRS